MAFPVKTVAVAVVAIAAIAIARGAKAQQAPHVLTIIAISDTGTSMVVHPVPYATKHRCERAGWKAGKDLSAGTLSVVRWSCASLDEEKLK